MNKLQQYLNAVRGILKEHFYFSEVEERKWEEAAADKADAGKNQTLIIKEN